MSAAERLSPADLDALADLVAQRLRAPAGPLGRTEAAQALGVSTSTLDRAVRAGCPVQHFNGRRRFDVAAVRAWFAAEKSRTAAMSAPKSARDVDVDRELRELGRKVRR